MRTLLSMAFLAILLLLLLLVSQNQAQMANRLVLTMDLSYLQIRLNPIRIDLLMIGAFAAGFLLAAMLGAPSRVRGALERRRLKRQVRDTALPVLAASGRDTEGA